MKKRILCLVMTVIMAAGTSMTVFAADREGKDGWQVSFDGKNVESNFKSSDVADETADIQPGDSIKLKVTLQNSSADKTDWYMTNEVVETLEDAQKQASGGAYEYRLSFINAAGEEKVIYDSETVGGEGKTQTGEGLHEATQSLENYFYLDRLDAGKSGAVHLWVKVDGETQGNGYQQTLAKLQMNFAVEKVVAAGTKGPDRVIKKTTTVKTGDTSKLLLFSALALISGVILLIVGIYTMKKRGRKRKGE